MRSRYFIRSVLCLFTGLALITTATAQQAQEDEPRSFLTPLDGINLEAAFSGKTMDGIYKIPRERTGTNKFTEAFNADGTADYFEGPIVDKGQWVVRGPLIIK